MFVMDMWYLTSKYRKKYAKENGTDITPIKSQKGGRSVQFFTVDAGKLGNVSSERRYTLLSITFNFPVYKVPREWYKMKFLFEDL